MSAPFDREFPPSFCTRGIAYRARSAPESNASGLRDRMASHDWPFDSKISPLGRLGSLTCIFPTCNCDPRIAKHLCTCRNLRSG
mmetsp:Transcript_20781/g.35695  ORF Transcript_20781/g.35695 Transcript_20781/m.35695 type:complete len:84 (+) Transcript_20781:855-1106(+)